MKKVLVWGVILGVAAGLASVSCKKKTTETKGEGAQSQVSEEKAEPSSPSTPSTPSPSATVQPTQQGGSAILATALCKKLAECGKQAPEGTVDVCASETAKLMDEAISKKGVTITNEQFAKCADAIKAGACEIMEANEPPAGCEFLK
jgi:hypothetical protein